MAAAVPVPPTPFSNLSITLPMDTISSMTYAPSQVGTQDLVMTSWSGDLVLTDTQPSPWAQDGNSGSSDGTRVLGHSAPLLSSAWSGVHNMVFAGSGAGSLLAVPADRFTRSTRVASAGDAVFATRTDPRSILPHTLVTASWDGKIRVYDIRTLSGGGGGGCVGGISVQDADTSASTSIFSARAGSSTGAGNARGRVPVAMDFRWPWIVVGTGNCSTIQYDVRKLDVALSVPRTLKSPIAALAVSTAADSYIVGGIGGRAAVVPIGTHSRSANFSFKCHRQRQTPKHKVGTVSHVVFDPLFQSFVTGGSDGTLNFWCHRQRQRFKNVGSFGRPITAIAYSADGSTLAVATGEDWTKGSESAIRDPIPPSVYTAALDPNWRDRGNTAPFDVTRDPDGEVSLGSTTCPDAVLAPTAGLDNKPLSGPLVTRPVAF